MVDIPVFVVGVSFVVVFDCCLDIMSNFAWFGTIHVDCNFVDIAPPTNFV